MNSSNQDAVLKRSELRLSTEYAEPEDSIGKALADIWQQVLNIDSIGVNDDFFEIGGDSLGASVIAGEIELRYGCKFSPSQLVDLSTIAQQVVYIEEQRQVKGNIPSNLTVCHGSGKKPPLFFVHGARGFTLYNKKFLEALDADRPLIFIEAVGLDGKAQALESVEEIAANYICSMRQMAPGGHWLLAANCAGGLIAMEICKQAEQSGEVVARLMLVDPLYRLFRKPYQVRLKRWRSKLIQFLLPSQSRSRLKSSNSSLLDEETVAYEESLDADRRRQASLETRIQMRVGEHQASLIPSNVPYSADAMRQVSRVLGEAFTNYTSSRWSGSAFVLMTEVRDNKLANFKSIIPNAKFRTVPFNHKSLFAEGLPEIVKFIDDALHADAENIFWITK